MKLLLASGSHQHECLGTPLALSYHLDLISLRVQNSVATFTQATLKSMGLLHKPTISYARPLTTAALHQPHCLH